MDDDLLGNSLAKKLAERELIDQFLAVCTDYEGYAFSRYSENPDLVYTHDNHELGFESIVISDGQKGANYYFDRLSYRLEVPAEESAPVQLQHFETFMHNKLMKHIRKYSLPTVFVFSMVGNGLKIGAGSIAGVYMLPEFEDLKILDYYVFDGSKSAKILHPDGFDSVKKD